MRERIDKGRESREKGEEREKREKIRYERDEERREQRRAEREERTERGPKRGPNFPQKRTKNDSWRCLGGSWAALDGLLGCASWGLTPDDGSAVKREPRWSQDRTK